MSNVISVSDLGSCEVGNRDDRLGLNPNKHTNLHRISLDARKRVEHLIRIQKEHNQLKAQFYKDRGALEAKYEKLYQPLYDKRYLIVNGVVEADKVTNDSEAVNQGVDAPEQSAEKGVPNFWLHALVNHELLDAEINIRDGEALKYLTDIKWLRKEDPKGFILEFCFNKNPFFKNSVLTKTYQLPDEDETILHKAIGIEIEWYPENCLTKECESFFNFFNPLQIDIKAEKEFIEDMRRDYYIGSTIRNEIIPVLFYGM
ncbi:hypothetical protein M0R45_038162 [Rubus argutus]|uniref:Uncharacterized protein n=1 Tax=Rubus argutus TaxID=59490 RepID=A0AAW1W1I9_RUBAR